MVIITWTRKQLILYSWCISYTVAVYFSIKLRLMDEALPPGTHYFDLLIVLSVILCNKEPPEAQTPRKSSRSMYAMHKVAVHTRSTYNIFQHFRDECKRFDENNTPIPPPSATTCYKICSVFSFAVTNREPRGRVNLKMGKGGIHPPEGQGPTQEDRTYMMTNR